MMDEQFYTREECVWFTSMMEEQFYTREEGEWS